MNRHHIVILILLLSLSFSSFSNASSVFKVTKDGESIYLGGTIHVLTEKDFPLDDAYQKAFEASDELYFEIDMGALNSPEVQGKYRDMMFQKNGRLLNDSLTKESRSELASYLKSRNIDEDNIQVLTPVGAMLVLTITEYQMRGFTQEGVDMHFYKKAKASLKPVSWLETIEFQLDMFKSFNAIDANILVSYILDEVTQANETINEIHQAWKNGDMETLSRLSLTLDMEESPEVYEKLLPQRNNAWLPKIVAMFDDEDTEFVLVGALHLAGDDGLIKLLEDKGYTVEKLKP